MKFNLQFFADEDVSDIDISIGAEEPAFAEQEETVNEGEQIDEQDNTPTEPTVDRNAIYAEARRTMERQMKEEQAHRDAEYVRRFGHLTNPVTNQPIRSEADYLEALDAQERRKAEAELVSKGVNIDTLNKMIQDSPVVRKANEYIMAKEQQDTLNLINEDIAELSKMDSSIKSIEDVPIEVINKCSEIRGLRLVDAYKMLNYGKITSEKADAIRQSAINQAKGKNHLQPVNGVSVNDNSVDIPQNLRSLWEEAFPNKTWAERKALYNKQL